AFLAAGGDVPDAGGLIVAAGGEAFAVAAEGDAEDFGRVPTQGAALAAGIDVPETHTGFHLRRPGEPAAVGAESAAEDGDRGGVQLFCDYARLHVADLDLLAVGDVQAAGLRV